MASSVDIVNIALTLLGESRIMNLTDNTKPAREANAIFEYTRDALLGGFNWSFAKVRAQLPALVDVPEFGFDNKFQMPVDCLRLIFVGDYYVGADLTNYRGSDTSEFAIEGREILTNLAAPLNIRYIKKITDASQFSPNFTYALAAKLAVDLAEPLTQSETKAARAESRFMYEIRQAVRANAIELPPEKLPDDEWVLARL